MLIPGHGLGVLGGGQLGRMFVSASQKMGYHTLVYDPDTSSPAGSIATEHIHAEYSDKKALDNIADRCSAITVEFESVPVEALIRVAQNCPTYPSAKAFELTQDRNIEKNFLCDSGIETVAFAEVTSPESLSALSARQVPMPGILKLSRFGYDGKGQIPVQSLDEAHAAFDRLGSKPCILEEAVDLETELSVIVVRSVGGETQCYPIAENIHHNGILHMSIVPAQVDDEIAQSVAKIGKLIATKLEYCGVLGVEFFLTKDRRLLVNEIAPRPHNSGHYTLDACHHSQFEQMVRVMCGLPCGSTQLFSPVVMVNLLGDIWDHGGPNWETLLDRKDVKLHLYGKHEIRSGRKMGHFCMLGDQIEPLKEKAQWLWRQLKYGELA